MHLKNKVELQLFELIGTETAFKNRFLKHNYICKDTVHNFVECMMIKDINLSKFSKIKK